MKPNKTKKVKVKNRDNVEFDANQTDDTRLYWRLVHDGIKVRALFKSTGVSTCMDTIFVAETEQECLDEMDRLNLVPLPTTEV